MNTARPIVHDLADAPIPFVPVELCDAPIPFVPVDLRDAGDVLGRAPSFVGRVDWTNLAPHPELALLGDRCRCGQMRGEHGAQSPYAAKGCRRYREGTAPSPRARSGAAELRRRVTVRLAAGRP